MQRLPFLRCSLLFAVACGCRTSEAAERRPNVLVILSDDQGMGDFSCHGNPVLRTPHLDRLHGESVRLADFHVAPMCTPTRGQLLTGLDALHNGATSVCAGRSFIRRGIPTMPEIFSAAGYRTGIFGKWHLGDSYPNLPHQRGFHEAVYHLGWGITSMADVWLNDCFDGRFARNGKLQRYPGYCTDVFFDQAMRFMQARAVAGEPFFVYLPTNAPHGPHWVADGYQEPYRGRGPAAFFGMLANLDENLGRLDEFLRRSKLYDDTIVVYFHDNGGTAGVKTFNAGLRAGKTTYYDGGHRAACFVRWPEGGLGMPRDVGDLTQVQDLLPTLVDFCGLTPPQGATFDGASLAPLLRGAKAPELRRTLDERILVVQYGQEPKMWDCCLLLRSWRLVHGKELYDTAVDRAQTRDVAAQHPEVVARLREHYERWWAGVEPRLYDFSPVSIGAPQENPVTLTAADWANVYCDNMQNLRAGLNRNSQWHLLVEQAGEYEIELRRWPREADAPIAAGVPKFVAVAGEMPAGKALPIARARLKIGDRFDEARAVETHDKEITFTTTLPAGRTTMQSWFSDATGEELCGAYFAYVRRK